MNSPRACTANGEARPSRHCVSLLAAIAETLISGVRVARELDGLVAPYGVPAMIVSDNGPELDREDGR
jgi:hypothetical protein